MYCKWYLGLLMIGVFQIGKCQLSDTLPEVKVYSKVDSIYKMAVINTSVPYYQFNEFVLQNLGVVDIGEALKHVPGSNVKDYGGIGGLKTVSYRSLGNTHTGVEQDGISVQEQQSGTINMGNYSVFGVKSVEMSSGQIQHDKAFASSYLKANMISIFNLISNSSEEKTVIKTHSEWMTINALQNGVLVRQKIGKRLFVGGMGNYRFGNGIYSYELVNGQNIIRNERAPTNLKQGQIDGCLQYKHKNLSVSLLASHKNAFQNLPGAVIFYNPYNKETLTNDHNQAFIKAHYKFEKYSISGHVFNQKTNTIYFQDFVLNNQGYIQNEYKQFHNGGGLMFRRYIGSLTQFIFAGSDLIQTRLSGNQYEAHPLRQSWNSVIGLSKWLGYFKLQGNITHQYIFDKGITEQQVFNHFSPFVSLGYIPKKNRSLRFRSFYKNAFRIPSFNDLYYRSIGNIDLLPEKADLFNVGMTIGKDIRKLEFESTIDIYHHIVSNKIVAIPTKNLFNWSMQNIGKTKGQGIDINLLTRRKISTIALTFTTQQSLNRSIDITDPNGFTYGHQLPYTPRYFASYQLNVQHTYITGGVNMIHSGGRYVLNENVDHHFLEGFIDLGLNMIRTFKLKNGQSFTLKVQANNILNKNYQVIRSFPMPGRHYAFTFQYQLTR